ncbi:MAG TPA: hypothetical protein VFF29_06130, partial [Bacteroidota bacterium]|nr:hypothetical protein [Bacteroidota bacterium]
MFVVILLLRLGLLIFHVFGVPYYFKSPEKPGAVFKTQLISLGIAIVGVIVLFAISETDLWSEDLMTLSIGILMVAMSLSALDLYMLRVTYKKKHTEEAFIVKYARQEERMREITERKKELEVRGKELESKGKEFEMLKTFLDNQKEQIKSRESAIGEKESVLISRAHSLNSREEQIDELVKGKLSTQEREIEERLQVIYNQKFTDHMNSMAEKMEKRISSEKQSLVQDVFSFDGKGADDIFELKRTKESIDKEKAELEKNRFLLDVDERVSKAREHVLEAKNSALEVRSENVDLRSDLK